MTTSVTRCVPGAGAHPGRPDHARKPRVENPQDGGVQRRAATTTNVMKVNCLSNEILLSKKISCPLCPADCSRSPCTSHHVGCVMEAGDEEEWPDYNCIQQPLQNPTEPVASAA